MVNLLSLLIISSLVALNFTIIQGFSPRQQRQGRLRASRFTKAAARASETSIEDVARNAVLRAGNVILKGVGSIDLTNDIVSKIGSRDIVTQVDKDAQEVIRQTIVEAFPEHKFLGEEDVEPGMEAASRAIENNVNEEHLWIVDPIDGTTNFAHGMPLSGVILAYASKGEVLYGCIYDPYRNEIFTAWKGKGAYLNGKRIHCCDTQTMKNSVIATGSPPNFVSLAACLRATNLISSEVRTMRMLGSAAIMLTWVACGRLTAYFEADLNAWDLAAGSLIINEAGGKVTDVWGKDYQLKTRNLVATNGHIHDELLQRLQVSQMWMRDEDKPKV